VLTRGDVPVILMSTGSLTLAVKGRSLLLVTMVYSSMEEREALFSSTMRGAEDKDSEYKSLEYCRQSSSSSVNSEDSAQDSPAPSPSHEEYEGRWAWVVLLASFLCLCVLDGISYTFGMFLGPLMEELKCGRSAISTAGSLQVGIYSMSGIFASRLVTRYGSRPVCMAGTLIATIGLVSASYSWNLPSLLASYSVITGLGFGLMYIPAVVVVAEHFNKRRALAMGICVCGTGVGTFLLAPLELSLLSAVGWRWTFVCMGGLCSLCVVCGLAMSPVELCPSNTQLRRRRSTVVSFHGVIVDDMMVSSESIENGNSCLHRIWSMFLSKELLESPGLSTFLLVALGDGVATLALFIPFTFLPDFAMAAGVSSKDAAFLISAAGISSSVGRISSGWICDKPWCDPIVLTTVAVLTAALPSFLFPWVSAYPLFLLLSCMFGLLTGFWISATSPLLVRVLGLPLLPPAFGLMTAVQGAAALAGPPLAGAATDWLGDRAVALHCTGGLLVAAAAVFLVAAWQHGRGEHRRQYRGI